MYLNENNPNKANKRRKRRKQLAINNKLKKILLGNNAFGFCCYCNLKLEAKKLTVEHKIPICLGGTSEISNIDLACAPCNQSRGREAWLFKKSLNKQMVKNYTNIKD